MGGEGGIGDLKFEISEQEPDGDPAEGAVGAAEGRGVEGEFKIRDSRFKGEAVGVGTGSTCDWFWVDVADEVDAVGDGGTDRTEPWSVAQEAVWAGSETIRGKNTSWGLGIKGGARNDHEFAHRSVRTGEVVPRRAHRCGRDVG